MSSPAYKRDGLLVITFDESEHGDASCVLRLPGAAERRPTPASPVPAEGASAHCCCRRSPRRGTTITVPYNHYSLLCSVENIFGLDHLGYAAQPGLACFGPEAYGGAQPAPSTSSRRIGADAREHPRVPAPGCQHDRTRVVLEHPAREVAARPRCETRRRRARRAHRAGSAARAATRPRTAGRCRARHAPRRGTASRRCSGGPRTRPRAPRACRSRAPARCLRPSSGRPRRPRRRRRARAARR